MKFQAVGKYLENVWKMSGKSYSMMPGKQNRKLENVWKISGKCLDNPDIFQIFSRHFPTAEFVHQVSWSMIFQTFSRHFPDIFQQSGICIFSKLLCSEIHGICMLIQRMSKNIQKHYQYPNSIQSLSKHYPKNVYLRISLESSGKMLNIGV